MPLERVVPSKTVHFLLMTTDTMGQCPFSFFLCNMSPFCFLGEISYFDYVCNTGLFLHTIFKTVPCYDYTYNFIYTCYIVLNYTSARFPLKWL